jgi:hypothetical protein
VTSHADSVRTTTKSGARWYDWKGERFWSVTTIIAGGYPKPVLINWAKKFTAEYAVDNFPKLTALLEQDTDGTIDRQGAIDWLKSAAFRERDKKGDLGTSVHNAIEAHVLGKPTPEWPLPLRPRMLAFERFLAEYEPRFIPASLADPAEAVTSGVLLAEAPVFNRTQHYAGTLDGIVEIGGRTLVLDVKTSAKGIYPEIALQLAAYRFAEFVGLPDGSEQALPQTQGAVALHLPEDGTYELREIQADEETFRHFLYVREVYRYIKDIADGVIRGVVPLPGTVSEEQLAMAAGWSQGPDGLEP